MRSGMQRFPLAGLALVMCVAWAVPATARDSGMRQGYREHRGRHHDHYRADRGRRHDHYRGASGASRSHRGSVYYCAACRHRFDSRGRFYHHLQQHHHIPPWQLPWVVVHGLVHGGLGWVFHG